MQQSTIRWAGTQASADAILARCLPLLFSLSWPGDFPQSTTFQGSTQAQALLVSSTTSGGALCHPPHMEPAATCTACPGYTSMPHLILFKPGVRPGNEGPGGDRQASCNFSLLGIGLIGQQRSHAACVILVLSPS